jgi:uncharacterized repeat protein (TIGR02543 family)
MVENGMAEFAGWAVASGSEVAYNPVDHIEITEDITLYAVWKAAENEEGSLQETP